MNLLLLIFSLLSSLMIIFGTLTSLLEDKIPSIFLKAMRYGKFSYQGKVCRLTELLVIDIPKSSFRHFYKTAIFIFGYVFYLTTAVYFFNGEVPSYVNYFLILVCGEDRVAHTPAIKAYIAVTLLMLQVIRRFYDTHYVSVFGKNSYINLAQYVIGICHYPGAAVAILCESPVFAQIGLYGTTKMDLALLTYKDMFAVALFMWAWWHQHVTTKILADLRKNKKGAVVTEDHKLPHGDWFEYLSAPHQTAEILMYLSIALLLNYNLTWFFVFTWVLSNQVITILMSHKWCQENFQDFPRGRKALIPFVY